MPDRKIAAQGVRKMHVGCCENCRYIDLIENMSGKCPRCRSDLRPIGVDSAKWNTLPEEEKIRIIMAAFPEAYAQTPVEPSAPASAETPVAPVQPSTTAPVQPSEAVSAPTQPSSTIPAQSSATGETGNSQRVYVCYKCNSIAGHDGRRDSYFCTECGSSMVDVGYTVDKWADLSKEEKRKVTEEAKIRHMVNEIKNTDFDENESVQTARIINVVGSSENGY